MRRAILSLLFALLLAAPASAGETGATPPPSDGERARVAELLRQIECQEARIRELEQQAAMRHEDGVELIPFLKINARFSPTLLHWRDRLWELGGQGGECAR